MESKRRGSEGEAKGKRRGSEEVSFYNEKNCRNKPDRFSWGMIR